MRRSFLASRDVLRCEWRPRNALSTREACQERSPCRSPRWRRDRKGARLLQCNVSSSGDRKSTRLNSSHSQISYAVFCLKKKKKKTFRDTLQSIREHLQYTH